MNGICALLMLVGLAGTAAPLGAVESTVTLDVEAPATPRNRGAPDFAHCPMDGYWQRAGKRLQESDELGERLVSAWLLKLHRGFGEVCAQPASAKADESRLGQALAEALLSDDPVILALASVAAAGIAEQRALTRRWAELEPGNLAPLVFGRVPTEELLPQTGARQDYLSHSQAQVRLLFEAFRQVPMSREEANHGLDNPDRRVRDADADAVMAAWAIWAAIGLPAFQELTQPCKGQALKVTALRRAECMQLGRTLALRSDGVLEKSIGIAIVRNSAQTDADAMLAESLRHTADWQRGKWMEVLVTLNEQAQATHAIRMLQTPGIESEVQAMQATLRENGIPLEPPADWPGPPASLPAAGQGS